MGKLKAKNAFLLIILSLFVVAFNSSCSPLSHQDQSPISRTLAQNELSQYEIEDLIEKALEVGHSKKKSTIGFSPRTLAENFSLKLSRVDFIKNDQLPKETAFKIFPFLKNNEYHIQVQYSSAALQDEGAYLELRYFFSIFEDKAISPYAHLSLFHPIVNNDTYKETAFFELIYNAKKGHIPALRELIEKKSLGHSSNAEYFQEKLAILSKEQKKIKTIDTHSFHKIIFELKKNPQFTEFIAKNNRAAVVNLINMQIPWAMLTPFEVQFWKTQLEIIKNPLPPEQRVLVYRGLKTENLLNKFQENKMVIFNNQKFYQLANYFSSNGEVYNSHLENSLNTSILSKNLKLHSLTSSKSLFISFTPQPQIAKSFAEDAVAALAVDPRSLFFNETNYFTSEKEFLMSFVTFPEDILAIVEVDPKERMLSPIDSFKIESKLSEKIRSNLQKKNVNVEVVYSQLRKNSSNHFKSLTVSVNSQKNLIHHILQKELVAGPEVLSKTKIPSVIKGCLDMIKVFF